jgi:hypothetical protein
VYGALQAAGTLHFVGFLILLLLTAGKCVYNLSSNIFNKFIIAINVIVVVMPYL